MSMFILIMAFLLGALVGGFAIGIINSQPCSGRLRIDKSDSDGPYLFLELKEPVESLEKRDYAYLKVVQENFLPQD